MIELLPPYLRQYKEMQQIMSVEDTEIETINNTHNQLVDNRYITTCDETGIKRFETMLHITPLLNDTLADRKLRCITKWNQKLPYNYSVLENKIAQLCGSDGYSLELNFSSFELTVKLALGVKNQFDIVKNMVIEMVPCNIVTNIQLMYNTHEILKTKTHSQLASFTYGQVREEVL